MRWLQIAPGNRVLQFKEAYYENWQNVPVVLEVNEQSMVELPPCPICGGDPLHKKDCSTERTEPRRKSQHPACTYPACTCGIRCHYA